MNAFLSIRDRSSSLDFAWSLCEAALALALKEKVQL